MRIKADGQVLDLAWPCHIVVEGQAHRVHVRKGAVVDLVGRFYKGIVIDRGARAVIYGICYGDLTNRGDVDFRGILIGKIKGRGRTRVAPDALVGGVRGRDLRWDRTELSNTEIMFEGKTLTHITPVEGWLTVIGAPLIEMPVVVEGDVTIVGGATQGAHVHADSRLTVLGVVAGGITVDPGGHAAINGSCVGGITNNGEVDIAGVVFGEITGDGQTRVAPDAMVNDVKGSDLRQ